MSTTPKKAQVIPPGLWIVATPIGNLADGTHRMEQALRECDFILAEDTRRAGILLQTLGITQKRVERFDAHSDAQVVTKVVAQLQGGAKVALVTDAGTPGVSDPGAVLVKAAHGAGVRVTPVPGVSAVATLISVCGFEQTQFTFYGFFPRESKARTAQVTDALKIPGVHVWYESPERICAALEDLDQAVRSAGAPLKICVAKELTKLHERLFWGQISEVLSEVKAHVKQEGARGEWGFVLENDLQNQGDAHRDETDQSWKIALECLAQFASKISVRDAVKTVCERFDVPKNTVYEAALKVFVTDTKN